MKQKGDNEASCDDDASLKTDSRVEVRALKVFPKIAPELFFSSSSSLLLVLLQLHELELELELELVSMSLTENFFSEQSARWSKKNVCL